MHVAGRSALDRRQRARPAGRATPSPKATARQNPCPVSRAGGRSARTGSSRCAPVARSERGSTRRGCTRCTRRWGVRRCRRQRSSKNGAGSSRLHSGLSSTITRERSSGGEDALDATQRLHLVALDVDLDHSHTVELMSGHSGVHRTDARPRPSAYWSAEPACGESSSRGLRLEFPEVPSASS